MRPTRGHGFTLRACLWVCVSEWVADLPMISKFNVDGEKCESDDDSQSGDDAENDVHGYVNPL